jgi:hypothetical protein
MIFIDFLLNLQESILVTYLNFILTLNEKQSVSHTRVQRYLLLDTQTGRKTKLCIIQEPLHLFKDFIKIHCKSSQIRK